MSICALVTRPPEIICCFYIFGNPKDIFVVFDSHPRPDIHPSGAGFIFKTSMNEMSEYLAHLLPFDNKLLEGDMQWEAQLLGNLTAHTLMAREQVNVSMIDEIKRASIEILTLKADLAKAKTDMNSLAEENRRLQNNVGQSKRPELPGPPAWTPRRTWGPFPTLQPKTLDLSSSAGPSMQGPVKQREPRSPLRSGKKASKKGARKALKDHSDDFSAQDLGMGDDDLAFALAQQRIYDEESARLKAERSLLGRSGLGTFECSVCFEKFSEEFVAKVSRCDHQFCRDCIRRYVETELEERKYPIFCPLCIVDEKGKERSSKLSPLRYL